MILPVLLGAALAAGQPRPPPPPAPAAGSERADDVSAPQLEPGAGAVALEPPPLSEPLLGPSGRARPGAPPALLPSQVARTAAPAEPPPALSDVRDGRAVVSAPVGGRDRCDPAEASAVGGVDCRRTLERRRAEFAGAPAPSPLTSEQRLLRGPQSADMAPVASVDADRAARRLEGGEVAGSLAAEAAAASAQAAGAAAATGAPSATPVAGAVVAAILDQAAGGSGAPGVAVIPPPR